MPSDGNLYDIYSNNINPDPSIGLGLVLPSQVDAFKVLNYKDSTSQPYIPIHNPNALQTLGQIGADSANVLINFFSKNNPANLSANNPIGLFQNDERLRGQFTKDIFIRGGISAPSYAVEDAQRLSKFFFDKKDVTGLLFTIKQNVLSLTNVNTIASPFLINGGVYLPTSTIAQAGVNAFGVHLNKQGIDPTGLIPLLSLKKYEDVAKKQEQRFSKKQEKLDRKIERARSRGNDNKVERLQQQQNTLKEGRLLTIYSKKQIQESNNNIYTYAGGPGSILGIGLTQIKFADQRTGINNPLYENVKNLNKNNKLTTTTDSYRFLFGGVKNKNLYRSEDGLEGPIIDTPDSNQQQIFPKDPNLKRPNYKQYNLEKTYNFTSPGKKGNRNNYTKGKLEENGNINNGEPISMGPSDKINGKSRYKANSPEIKDETRDIINFHIGVIDNTSSDFNSTYFLPFRAFIDDFSDKYDAKWKDQKYMGRAESFYKYGGFDRNIGLSMKVIAQSKEELMVQYEKLNFLASTLAPTYTEYGYMSGNLHRIYVGGYLDNQVCIIESLSFDFRDSPWEIGIDTNGNYDEDVSQLPHHISVQMKITPIHNFRVEMDRDGERKYIARTSPKGDDISSLNGNTFEGETQQEVDEDAFLRKAISESQGNIY
jgi:hypothetical protein